jgi:hypothetical protein
MVNGSTDTSTPSKEGCDAVGVALGDVVAGIACVNEINTSGVVVLAAVGTSLVGEIFTDTSHAKVMRMSMDRNKNIFFIF